MGTIQSMAMNGAQAGLAISVFLASAVEVVEAFTIVLAVGSTRHWSSALAGVGAALAALAVIVAVAGQSLPSCSAGWLRGRPLLACQRTR